MAATAGSVVVDLLMRTGSFETDGKRAEKTLKNLEGVINKWSARAVGGAAAAAAGFAAWTVSMAKTGGVIERFSQISNASAEEFQRMAYGAKAYGVEQEKLSDQLKDFNEKVGEYLQSGGGGMKDFFEQIAPKVGVTADQFRRLSGPEGLQLYYDSLERVGLSQKEISFYLESMASDTTALIPLLKNGGAELKALGEEAERFGAIMSSDAVRSAKEFERNLDRLQAMTSGVSMTFANQVLPVLNDFIENAIEAANETGGLLDESRFLAKDRALPEWLNLAGRGFAIFGDVAIGLAKSLVVVGKAFRAAAADAEVAVKAIPGAWIYDNLFGDGDGLESALKRRNEVVQSFNKSFDDLINYQGDAGVRAWDKAWASAQQRQVENQYGYLGLMGDPKLLDSVVITAPGSKSKKGGALDEGARYIQQLKERTALLGKEAEYEQLLARLSVGTLKFTTPEMEKQAKLLAQQLDVKERQVEVDQILKDLRAQQSTTQLQLMRDLESFGQGDRVRELNASLAQVEDRYRGIIEARRNSAQGLSDAELAKIRESLEKELEMVREYHDKKMELQSNWLLGAADAFNTYADNAANLYDNMSSATTSFFGSAFDAASQWATGMDVKFNEVALSFARMMVKMSMEAAAAPFLKIAGNFLGSLFMPGASAGNFAGGSLFGASWGPSFSLGGASSGLSGIGTLPLSFFDGGGWTGPGGRFEPKGIVHAEEGVLNRDEIRAIGGEAGFNALRRAIRGQGYAIGGMAGRPSLSPPVGGGAAFAPSLTINNNGTPQSYEVESWTREEIVLIARDEVNRNAPKVAAASLGKNNSPMRKSLEKNYKTTPRR